MKKIQSLDSLDSASTLFRDLTDSEASQAIGGQTLVKKELSNQQAKEILGNNFNSSTNYKLILKSNQRYVVKSSNCEKFFSDEKPPNSDYVNISPEEAQAIGIFSEIATSYGVFLLGNGKFIPSRSSPGIPSSSRPR